MRLTRAQRIAALTAERVREVLLYDEIAGTFRRRSTGKLAGGYDANSYRRVSVDGVQYLAHRLVWLYVYGRWPIAEIDHRDRNKSNFALADMREASRAQNKQNQDHFPSSKTGLKGVFFAAHARRYRAQITANGRMISLGYFDQADHAASAYRIAAAALHGQFSGVAL